MPWPSMPKTHATFCLRQTDGGHQATPKKRRNATRPPGILPELSYARALGSLQKLTDLFHKPGLSVTTKMAFATFFGFRNAEQARMKDGPRLRRARKLSVEELPPTLKSLQPVPPGQGSKRNRFHRSRERLRRVSCPEPRETSKLLNAGQLVPAPPPRPASARTVLVQHYSGSAYQVYSNGSLPSCYSGADNSKERARPSTARAKVLKTTCQHAQACDGS